MGKEDGAMHRSWTIAGVLAVVIAVLAVAAGTLAQSGAAAPNLRTTSIHVIEHAINVSYVPVGSLSGCTSKTGCQGDYTVFDDPLFAAGSQQQVGHIAGQCFLVNVSTALFQCPGVLFEITGRGTISSNGAFDGSGKNRTTFATIDGGTGDFVGAEGTVAVEPIDATHNGFVIHLLGAR
jgi:hypothetical protein